MLTESISKGSPHQIVGAQAVLVTAKVTSAKQLEAMAETQMEALGVMEAMLWPKEKDLERKEVPEELAKSQLLVYPSHLLVLHSALTTHGQAQPRQMGPALPRE